VAKEGLHGLLSNVVNCWFRAYNSFMTWQDVRKVYPNQWLLIEAIGASSHHQQRLLENIAVLEPFEDSRQAFKHYQALHKANREREYYVVHTSNEQLKISEVQWLGIRGSL
jgi:hypothetical protein